MCTTFANTLTLAPSTLIFRLLLCKYVLHAFLSNKINITYNKNDSREKTAVKSKAKAFDVNTPVQQFTGIIKR